MALRNVAIRVFFLLLVVSAAYAKGKDAEKKEEKKDAKESADGGTFDITKLGAKPDGKTDCTKVCKCNQAARDDRGCMDM